uniref:Helicase ATP-binding domain-containing protein n=1 Tax=Gongylonema pulchrum TaxID=637853 RepID=A0A183DJ39_9BILA
LVIDEFHMLFDASRGPLVEQIVGKMLYISQFLNATLPNLNELSDWLNAQKYQTQFRPVELNELIMCGSELYDTNTMEIVRSMPAEFAVPNDSEQIVQYAFSELN